MVAPAADPVAIRACLTPQVAAVFDDEWQDVLEELLHKWRFIAHAELTDPGSYFQVLATVARAQASGRAAPGSASAEEVRALIRARLAG